MEGIGINNNSNSNNNKQKKKTKQNQSFAKVFNHFSILECTLTLSVAKIKKIKASQALQAQIPHSILSLRTSPGVYFPYLPLSLDTFFRFHQHTSWYKYLGHSNIHSRRMPASIPHCNSDRLGLHPSFWSPLHSSTSPYPDRRVDSGFYAHPNCSQYDVNTWTNTNIHAKIYLFYISIGVCGRCLTKSPFKSFLFYFLAHFGSKNSSEKWIQDSDPPASEHMVLSKPDFYEECKQEGRRKKGLSFRINHIF